MTSTSRHLKDDLVVSGSLLRLTEDINVPARLVSNVGDVVAALGAQGSDLGDLLGGELDLLEVGGDTSGSDGLGDDTVATDLGPGEDDLGGGDLLAETLAGLLGDGLDLGAGDEEGLADHVVAEGGVGGDVDALLLAVLDQLGALEDGVTLDLVGGGDDAGSVDDGLELEQGISVSMFTLVEWLMEVGSR